MSGYETREPNMVGSLHYERIIRLLWEHFEAVPEAYRKTAEKRKSALDRIAMLVDDGSSKSAARFVVAREYGVSVGTLSSWQAKTSGLNQRDWLPALVPEYPVNATSDATKVAYDDKIWRELCRVYLSPGAAKLSACYRNLVELAEKNGWGKVPSERTLRRRLAIEYPDADLQRRLLPTSSVAVDAGDTPLGGLVNLWEQADAITRQRFLSYIR